MILKTNRRNALILSVLLGAGPQASALTVFECVRDLLSVTDRASFATKRQGVEEPFLANDKFLVFPEVTNGTVSGFYFYGPDKVAVYYDAIEIKGSRTETRHIGDLAFRAREGIFEMVAQPSGLETVTVPYLPGYQSNSSGRGGPVMLGASVLPVIGAFVSRPAMVKTKYHNPAENSETDVKRWIASHSMGQDRMPASLDKVTMNKTIVRLKTVATKEGEDLWRPLKHELKLRRDWIKTRNLDEQSFKKLSLIMEGSCKE